MRGKRISAARFARFSLQAALCAALLSACAVIHDAATDPKEKAPPIVGLHVSELPDATQMLLYRGRLLVSLTDGFERPYSHAGIAIVDTSADTVIAHINPFDDPWQIPWSVAALGDSLLYAVNYDGRVRVAEAPDAWLDVETPFPSGPDPEYLHPRRILTISGGRVLLVDRYTAGLLTVTNRNASPSLWAGPGQILQAAAQGNRLYALRDGSRKLIRAEGGTVDSLDLTNLSGKPGRKCWPELMVTRGDRLFVAMHVSDTLGVLDTGLVAVLDAATLAVDTLLKLRYPYRHASSNPVLPVIVDGKWYLPRFNGYGMENGGVDVIDLDNATVLGSALTDVDAQGPVHDFLPAGTGKAYVIRGIFNTGSWTVRRVAY